MMKRKFLFLVVFIAAFVAYAQTSVLQKHEVQSGETLYSIARRYNVSEELLQKNNPGLKAENLMAGKVIVIPVNKGVLTPGEQMLQVEKRPQFKTTHEVKRKETVYSVSRLYGVTETQLLEANPQIKKDKLKKGAIINIPYTEEENLQYEKELQRLEEEASKAKIKRYSTIKTAVILPFSLQENTMTLEAQKMTNLYQGFLLAVDSLKQRGCSVEVHAYDEAVGFSSIDEILRKPEMKEMQLIIGPVRQTNISSVANFAHQNKIAHVVPLANGADIVNEHPTTFQINVPYSLVYNHVYNRFAIMHKNDNVIFVHMGEREDNVSYMTGFKEFLRGMSIPYQEINASEFSQILALLKPGIRNVLIPSSGTSSAFGILCEKLDALELTSEYVLQLFGFPEWQTFTGKYEHYLKKYNCQFFTAFYSGSNNSRTQLFNSRFRHWFHQEQYSGIPRYGELGYDIGAYFIKGLNDFGSSFYENLHNYSYMSLEFPFNFEKKNSWSGFQNKSILIVTHLMDGSVIVR